MSALDSTLNLAGGSLTSEIYGIVVICRNITVILIQNHTNIYKCFADLVLVRPKILVSLGRSQHWETRPSLRQGSLTLELMNSSQKVPRKAASNEAQPLSPMLFFNIFYTNPRDVAKSCEVFVVWCFILVLARPCAFRSCQEDAILELNRAQKEVT